MTTNNSNVSASLEQTIQELREYGEARERKRIERQIEENAAEKERRQLADEEVIARHGLKTVKRCQLLSVLKEHVKQRAYDLGEELAEKYTTSKSVYDLMTFDPNENDYIFAALIYEHSDNLKITEYIEWFKSEYYLEYQNIVVSATSSI